MGEAARKLETRRSSRRNETRVKLALPANQSTEGLEIGLPDRAPGSRGSGG